MMLVLEAVTAFTDVGYGTYVELRTCNWKISIIKLIYGWGELLWIGNKLEKGLHLKKINAKIK